MGTVINKEPAFISILAGIQSTMNRMVKYPGAVGNANLIIDLTNEPEENPPQIAISAHNKEKNRKRPNSEKSSEISKAKRPRKSIGDCVVCLEQLGSALGGKLYVTKCGHVFCSRCLLHSLMVKRVCPTCRGNLKSRRAFHPLYLDLL